MGSKLRGQPVIARLDDAAFAALAGIEVWVVDCIREREHVTHSHVAQTLEWIERVKPRRAILTNLHIDLDYRELGGRLPEGVEPAFDGMRLELEASDGNT